MCWIKNLKSQTSLPLLEIHKSKGEVKVSNEELRKFGLLVGTAILLIFGLFLPWFKALSFPRWPFILCLFFWTCSFFFPWALRPLHRVLLLIGSILGWVNTRILLGLVYFLILTPMAWFLKVFGKEPLEKKLAPQLGSYRKSRESPLTTNMEEPF